MVFFLELSLRGQLLFELSFEGPHDEAVLRRAIIVFAGADVATGAVEMDVQRRRDVQLSEKTRDTGKIRIWNSRSIVTLRMRRKVTQNRHRSFAIPEAHE